MAAVLVPAPIPQLAPRPKLERPHLRVLQGGAQAGHTRPPYVRRRLVAAVLVVLVAATLVVVAQRAVELAGGSIQADPPAGVLEGPSGSEGYVVQPGDTLWSIAGEMHPEGDVRPVVDELARELGGAVVYPGQVLDLESLLR